MLTNEERREVARNLRGNQNDTLIPHRKGRNYGIGCHEAADRFWNLCDRVKKAGDYDIVFSTSSVLADLIEPEPERTCHVASHKSSRDDCWCEKWSLSCGHEAINESEYYPPSYCSERGAKVIG